ncbi:hypothetical protein GCM10010519_65620 [Streptomyces lactacystinicus]
MPAARAAARADRWIVGICALPPVLGRWVLGGAGSPDGAAAGDRTPGRWVPGRFAVRRSAVLESSIAKEDGRAHPPGCGAGRRSPIRDPGPAGAPAQQGIRPRMCTIADSHPDE